MQGKGPSEVTSNPSGTVTRPVITRWHGSEIDRFTMDFGAGAVAQVVFGELKLSLKQKITLVSLDGAGSFLTYGISERKGQFTATLAANVGSALTNMLANTGVKVRFGWGNATAGTVDGDLDFAFNMKIRDYKINNQEHLGVSIVGDIMADIANTVVPITVVVADAVDKAW
jgi:hypothetical protein